MTLEEAGTVAKICGIVGSGLVFTGGVVWWMSALYSKVSSIAKSLEQQATVSERLDEQINSNTKDITRHGYRISVLEDQAGIVPPREE